MPYDVIIGRNEYDKEKLGNKGLIYIGKGYVKMGQYTSLSNKIYLDVARSHVILVSGKRGSGKSYTLGVLTEEISALPKEVSQNICSLIFDTMGIYWTMKFTNEKDKKLLQEWELKPKNLPVKVFVPFGHFEEYIKNSIPVDEKFALDITELNAEDWILTFGLDMLNPVAIAIQRAVNKLQQKNQYNLNDLISFATNDSKSDINTKNAVVSLFEAANTWGIFAKDSYESTKISDLLNAGMTSVLDLSVYNSVGAFNVRALVISIVCKKIFNQRMNSRKKEEIMSISKGLDYTERQEKKENPLVWIFLDEVHEFLKKDEKTAATDALVQLLREGRQPGISLVMATQQPGKIHSDAMTQSDIVISHRVTAAPDIDALNQIMQTYLLEGIKQNMEELPRVQGSAIILDDNSERIYSIRMRPRFTWHGGESPTAIKIEKKI